MSTNPLHLTEGAVKGMVAAKVHKDFTQPVNSIDYTPDGLFMIVSSNDDSIIIYDCQTGLKKRQVNSKKYGVDQIAFTHAPNTAVHCSRKVDNTIRYLSLHDNKYIRYFPGHTEKVTSLCMSPLDDNFLSASLDSTIRLWDLRAPACQGLMHVTNRPVAAFDPEGLIFAAGINSQSIKLYDLRSFDRGPFQTFQLAATEPTDCDWTQLKFSPDGKSIMIVTNGDNIRLINAFDGKKEMKLHGVNMKGQSLEASYSPDSQYIFCGSPDKAQLHSWHVEFDDHNDSSSYLGARATEHSGPISCTQFNPKYAMLATACTTLVLWTPNVNDRDDGDS